MTGTRVQKFLDEARCATKYVVAGLLATGAHYATMAGIIQVAGGHEILATCVGFCVGALVKYPLNHRMVFRSQVSHRMAVPRYVASLAIGFVLNAAIFALLLATLPAHYMVAQVLTTGIVIVSNYLVARLWVFRHRAAPPKVETATR